MVFKNTDVGHSFNTILASNDYQGVPVTLTESLKAGTPIKNDGGKAADGKQAIGILLYDVDKDVNPNGTVVVDGIIDYDKAKASAGTTDLSATVDALCKELPNIVFRSQGKTYVGAIQATE